MVIIAHHVSFLHILGKAARLPIDWLEAAYRLAFSVRQVALAQLYKNHHRCSMLETESQYETTGMSSADYWQNLSNIFEQIEIHIRYYHILIWHVKCIQIKKNKPIICSVM